MLNAVESTHYGDAMNDTKASIDAIKQFIQSGHDKRNSLEPQTMTEQEVLDADERIHCLFYFITPHRMKAIDIEFINQLSSLVPIIPIVSKADMMTMNERKKLLNQITQKLNSNPSSNIYDFFSETCVNDEESKYESNSTAVNEKNVFMTICGERDYPWVKFDDNSKYTDIRRLQKYLLASGM